MPSARAVAIPLDVHNELVSIVRAATSPQRLVVRAKIVLRAASGATNSEIARQVGVRLPTVRKWRGRFAASQTVLALDDSARSGRPPTIPLEVRCALVKLACQRPTDDKAPLHDVWTQNALGLALARETNWYISLSEIGRILRAEDLRPHRMRLWLHSPDPDFQAKVKVVCDLYLSPPAGATVLCVDEKTGIQALSRRYPGRLPTRGRAGRREFEYVRHGTTTLIGAFDIRTGKFFGQCRPRRTAADLLEFMGALARKYPTGDIWIVWDNLNIHSGTRWAEFNRRHGGRFHFVHTPLHASWVNQIEVWFGILQRRVLRFGSFDSVELLARRIGEFIAHWNTVEGHPFRWTFRGRFQQDRRAA